MMSLSDEERDAHNKKVTHDSSWMCEIFQDNAVPVVIKKRILQELMQNYKQNLEEYHGQANQKD